MSNRETLPIDRIHALVDRYRVTCLWFLRQDYYPRTKDEVLEVLDAIERHGGVQAFQQAREAREWVSQRSS